MQPIEDKDKMAKKLTSLSGRDLSDTDLFNPTPEEDARQRREADNISFELFMSEMAKEHDIQNAKYLLGRIIYVGSDKQRRAWLKDAGYLGVHVSGKSEAVPIDFAPSDNIYAMYSREVKRLRGLLEN